MNKDKIDREIEKVKKVQLAIDSGFAFRPLGDGNSPTDDGKTQEDIIRSILGPNNSLVILPTGKGKSLCFQGVAMVSKGVTLVISPLRALIRSQVKMFNRVYSNEEVTKILGGPIRAIYPGMNRKSISEVIDLLEDSERGYRLLYLTPERFSQPKFMREFSKAINEKRFVISYVIVDEAHCMSQWGFDFRESYLPIGGFIKSLPKKPKIAAFTATATPRDVKQICGLLDKQGAEWDYFEYFEYRDNLNVKFINCPFDLDRRFEIVCKILSQKTWRKKGYSVIIYCNFITAVEQLYNDLCAFLSEEQNAEWTKDIYPQLYHGQMNDAKRERVEREFIRGKCNVIIATKAFGMGIDKDNVGIIIHYDFPVSIEDYYQEIGRAGRNKMKVPEAKCYVFRSLKLFDITASWQLRIDMDASNTDSPIMSKMSKETLGDIRYYKYYRLSQVLMLLMFDMIPYYLKYSIPKYFKTGSIYESKKMDDAIMEVLKKYYLGESEETDPYYEFISDIFTKSNRDELETIQEIKTIIKEVNEFHVNNTKIANIMRWHPDAYTLGEPCFLSIHEWKHKVLPSTQGILERKYILSDCAFVNLNVLDDYIKSRAKENNRFMNADREDIDSVRLEGVNRLWMEQENEKFRTAQVLYLYNNSMIIQKAYIRNNGYWADTSQLDVQETEDEKSIMLSLSFVGWEIGRSLSELQNKERVFHLITGIRRRNLHFVIYGKEKLSYFDMCVADAIYSIESKGCNIIYEKTILELLSGNPKATFSRDIRDASKNSEMNLKTMIVKSIEKMQQLRITIADPEGETIHNECFLPIDKRADTDAKQKGYSYDRVLPLYRYAESLNGELIRFPMTKMNDGKPTSAWTIVQNHYRLHRSYIASHARRGVGIVPTTEFEIIKPYMPEYVKKKTEKAIRLFQELNMPVRNLEIHSFYDEIYGDCTWRSLNRIACSCDLDGERHSWIIICEKGDKATIIEQNG